MIDTYRRDLNKKLAELAIARRRVREEKQGLDALAEQEGAVREALGILQGAAQAVQQQVQHQIASLVSRCLQTVFAEPYDFQINFEQKRGRTEANLVFVRDGVEVDPMSASGGGVVDVASFALRLSCLLLSRPALRRVLVLDEPFRFVSADYRGQLRGLLETLAKELECQFIIITHQEELKIGTVVEL